MCSSFPLPVLCAAAAEQEEISQLGCPCKSDSSQPSETSRADFHNPERQDKTHRPSQNKDGSGDFQEELWEEQRNGDEGQEEGERKRGLVASEKTASRSSADTPGVTGSSPGQVTRAHCKRDSASRSRVQHSLRQRGSWRSQPGSEPDGLSSLSLSTAGTSLRRCGRRCLGPLTFHPHAKGSSISLRAGGLLAERVGSSFKDAIVFTSRPLRVGEVARLRVERGEGRWHGALRLGVAAWHPSRLDPDLLPPFACPDLQQLPGFWVEALPEECACPGNELAFWVTGWGELHFQVNGGRKHKLLGGIDISAPLWGLIDVYGQTRALWMLGSKQKGWFSTRTSCPVQVSNPVPAGCFSSDEDCIICFSEAASTVLSCGHQCLCVTCVERVWREFGECPLCRQAITRVVHATRARESS
ncbi:NEUL3 ligase, partial [Atractosteus spatula]|nr:NEUL3 ligase [Atractosteus spatula]